ncbi:MAG: HD domain-containing protein [Lachnospiraceae bacterium]|nr:HD domain-containing protein [Lachnospiraceae bacterium]
MKYLAGLNEGDTLSDIYLCKHKAQAVTRNGKPYLNVILADKTGILEAKIWEPTSGAIADFEVMDYIYAFGDVSRYQGALQGSLKRVKLAHEGEYIPADYVPVSPFGIDTMEKELAAVIETVKNQYLQRLLKSIFIENKDFAGRFRNSSAAKSVHHSFVGGLMQHTLAVTRLCKYYVKAYPTLNHDLLISAALLHDIGKIREISPFPRNDYTDDGQLLGHIVMGSEMVAEAAKEIPDFPPKLLRELQHCILAHHGEYEFGSPKKPALIEAMALNFADNTDAKLETFSELISNHTAEDQDAWFGFNRLFDSNIRKTGKWQ